MSKKKLPPGATHYRYIGTTLLDVHPCTAARQARAALEPKIKESAVLAAINCSVCLRWLDRHPIAKNAAYCARGVQ